MSILFVANSRKHKSFCGVLDILSVGGTDYIQMGYCLKFYPFVTSYLFLSAFAIDKYSYFSRLFVEFLSCPYQNDWEKYFTLLWVDIR